jgi:hypothetical protein
MALPEIQLDILKSFVLSHRSCEGVQPNDLYREMFVTQPTLKLIVQSAINNYDWSMEQKDGYCKGVLQCWHLLNQQSIVEELNGK